MDLTRFVPWWIAWPVSLASTVAAIGAAALMFHAAAFAEYNSAIWSAVVFATSGLLWYIADMAASNRPVI